METIPAMMWDSLRGWVQRHEGHGIVEVTVTTNKEDYDRFKIRFPKISPKHVKGVADSGCQAPLMGTEMLYRLGLGKKDLVQVACRASSINGGSITVLGVILLRIIGEDKATGKTVEAAAQVRVAEGVKDLYLSKQVLRDLGVVDRDFPCIKVAGAAMGSENKTDQDQEILGPEII